jgi:tetratricopeptide (TPR) repeat protein
MDKISFLILDNDTKEKITNLNVTEDKIIKTENIKNITNYVKIAPNVYSFNDNNYISNVDNDIYILYNNACQVKKENKFNAIKIFKKCVKLINNKIKNEIVYEIYVNLALLISETNGPTDEVNKYYQDAINICSDRAEPYFYWAIYCNKNRDFEKSYNLLNKALLLSYDDVKHKYPETQFNAYGEYLYDELSVACYWLKKYNEGKALLDKIVDDPRFFNCRERLKQNLQYINIELSK